VSSSATVTPSDAKTILVKWPNGPPPGIPAVGELKTKVKIVRVPPTWTVEQTLAFYRSLPNVVYAEPNYVADQHGLAAPNDYWWSQQWGLQKIDALAGWDVYPGSYAAAGAPIAIVDSGIDASHPDLAGQVAPGANCLTGVCVAGGITIDDNGHGTVNAGAAAAAANNNRGVAGLAHGARLIPVKVLSATGTGTYAAIAAGIIWAADNGAKVVNLSLGGLAPSRTLCDAVTYALGRSAFVAAASGNLGTDAPVYPAACEGAVGVGATDQNDSVPPWSDTGPSVFVSAPGVSIHATYPGDRYALATGTSIAAALVSGLASLLEAQSPARTPADIRRILASTSDKDRTGGLVRPRPVPHDLHGLHVEREGRVRPHRRRQGTVRPAGRARHLVVRPGLVDAAHADAAAPTDADPRAGLLDLGRQRRPPSPSSRGPRRATSWRSRPRTDSTAASRSPSQDSRPAPQPRSLPRASRRRAPPRSR
jgi:thermitase